MMTIDSAVRDGLLPAQWTARWRRFHLLGRVNPFRIWLSLGQGHPARRRGQRLAGPPFRGLTDNPDQDGS